MFKFAKLSLILTCFGLIGLLALQAPSAARSHHAKQPHGSKQSLAKKLANVNHNISVMQAKLAKTKKMQRSAAQRLAESEHKLVITRSELHSAQNQLQDTRHHLVLTKDELHKVQTHLETRNELLSNRLSDTYKHGGINYLSVLIGSTDFWDLLSRGHMIRHILNSDIQLIDGIKHDKTVVEQKKAVLQVQEQKKAALEQQKSTLTRVAYVQTVQRSQILSEISQERRREESDLRQWESNSRQIEAMIRAMQRTPKGRQRMVKAYHGRLIIPVSGYHITDPFGMRYHPILHQYRMHTGVDLACPKGTIIHAAGDGVVIFAGWYGAYGNAIIIDHGGGVSTVYGHCSSLIAHTGMSVKQGQQIARVGSTGLSTGPHCHFEVRHNGHPVQPL